MDECVNVLCVCVCVCVCVEMREVVVALLQNTVHTVHTPLPLCFAVFQSHRTLPLSLCLPVYSGGSCGQLKSVCVGARSSAGPPRGAAFPSKACRLELHFLLRPEGGKQVSGGAAGSGCSSQHGPHRG